VLKYISGFSYKESEKAAKQRLFGELDLPFAFCEAPA